MVCLSRKSPDVEYHAKTINALFWIKSNQCVWDQWFPKSAVLIPKLLHQQSCIINCACIFVFFVCLFVFYPLSTSIVNLNLFNIERLRGECWKERWRGWPSGSSRDCRVGAWHTGHSGLWSLQPHGGLCPPGIKCWEIASESALPRAERSLNHWAMHKDATPSSHSTQICFPSPALCFGSSIKHQCESFVKYNMAAQNAILCHFN